MSSLTAFRAGYSPSRVLAFSLALFALHGTLTTYPASGQVNILVAHRGASADAPENTLVALDRAIQLGADVIEIDVQLSRDFVPVLVHNPTLESTTNVASVFPRRFRRASKGARNWLVGDFRLTELRRLDAGMWFGEEYQGTRIPTLEEALRLVAGRVPVMVELKPSSGPRVGRQSLTSRVADVVATSAGPDSQRWVAFASADRDALRRMPPQFAKFLVVDYRAGGYHDEELFETDLCGILASRRLVDSDRAMVQRAHLQGRLVLAWSFDSSHQQTPASLVSEMRRYVNNIGVDGLVTNRLADYGSIVGARAGGLDWSICQGSHSGADPRYRMTGRPNGAANPLQPTGRTARPR